METEDLWGELPKITKQQTPLSIIIEQASILTAKTGQNIVASVIQYGDDMTFGGVFRLASPKLGKFTVDLFRISYFIGLYPVKIEPHLEGLGGYVASDVYEYKVKLREVFASEPVRLVISRILTQVESME